MSDAVCYLEPSLGSFTLLHNDQVQVWRQPEESGDTEPSIDARASGSARAITELTGKLSCVVVGIDHASFRWISSPSREQAIVATAARRSLSEERAGLVTSTVQPLDAAPESRSALMRRISKKDDVSELDSGAMHTTVLVIEDAPSRLWFDALERHGVMPRDVITTWHALARVWGAEDRCSLVVCEVSPERLVWAICRDTKVLVGGQGHLGDPHATVSRCTMDWLTWCAELGIEIETMHLVMREPDEFERQCASRWDGVAIETSAEDNPLEAMLRSIQERGTPEEQARSDPRRSLTSITHRSNRLHRRLIRVSSVALILLGLGIGIVGFRLYSIGQNLRREATTLENQNWAILQRAMELDDRSLSDMRARQLVPDIVLQGEVVSVQSDQGPIEAPPPPLPIYEENQILMGQITGHEDITFNAIALDQRTAIVRITTEAYAPAESLIEAIRQSQTNVQWTDPNPIGRLPNLTWEFKGEWEEDE